MALGDGVAGAAACLLAQLFWGAHLGRGVLNPVVVGPLYFGAAWIAVFLLIDGYSALVPANRIRSTVVALKATPYVGILALVGFFVKPYELTRPTVVVSVLFGLFLVIAIRLLLAAMMHGETLAVRVVVIGRENLTQNLAEALRDAGFECRLVGWLPTVDADLPSPPAVLISRLRELVSRQRADEVVAARDDLKLMPEFIEACTSRGIRVVSVGSLIERFQSRVPLTEIDSDWLLQIPAEDLWDRPYLLLRRMADVGISVTVGLALLPVVLVIALLIKVDSPGPALIRQRRVGQYGREFEMLKLRSMRRNAEVAGPSWAQPSDPRVTRIGGLLRATHLDEVPQLVNIFRGEMSLIGPRPERPEFFELFDRTLPHFRSRLVVKPGLTGWAQVNTGYAASVLEATSKLEYDLYYVKNQSLRLDLQIMLLTAFAVTGLRGR